MPGHVMLLAAPAWPYHFPGEVSAPLGILPELHAYCTSGAAHQSYPSVRLVMVEKSTLERRANPPQPTLSITHLIEGQL